MITTHSIAAKHPGLVGALWGGIGVAAGFGVPTIILLVYWGVFPPSARLLQALLGASLLGALFGAVLRSSYERMRWDIFGMIVAGLVPVIGFPLVLAVDYAPMWMEQGLSVGQALKITIGYSSDLLKLEVEVLPFTLVWICSGFIVGTIVQYRLNRASAAKSAPAPQ